MSLKSITGRLRIPVPDDAGVVLLLEGLAFGSTSTPRGMCPLISSASTSRAWGLRFLGRVGELDAAGLHPAAGEHLRLDDDGAADPLGDRARLGGRSLVNP